MAHFARFVVAAVSALCVATPARAAEDSPYKLVRGFLQLPPGLKLGAVSGVATDRDGNVLVFHRGDPRQPILVFTKGGKFLRSFGASLFTSTHGLRIDPAGKFLRQFANGVSPYGLFITQDDTLFIADGVAHKVLKMTPEGKLQTQWGTGGREPGNFLMPHGLCVSDDGAVYVAEVTGGRVQKFVAKE